MTRQLRCTRVLIIAYSPDDTERMTLELRNVCRIFSHVP